MDVYYKHKLQTRDDKDLSIKCIDKTLQCSSKIVKACSGYIRNHLKDFEGEVIDFSVGEITYNADIVLSVLNILQDTSAVSEKMQILTPIRFDKVVSIIELLDVLMIKEYIISEIFTIWNFN